MYITRVRIFFTLCAISVGAGCSQGPSVETEMQIAELENYAMELEGQLEFLYAEMAEVSRNLSASVNDLESALSDVHLSVLDLPSGELAITMREVEARVAVANQRLAAVRTAATDFASISDF